MILVFIFNTNQWFSKVRSVIRFQLGWPIDWLRWGTFGCSTHSIDQLVSLVCYQFVSVANVIVSSFGFSFDVHHMVCRGQSIIYCRSISFILLFFSTPNSPWLLFWNDSILLCSSSKWWDRPGSLAQCLHCHI